MDQGKDQIHRLEKSQKELKREHEREKTRLTGSYDELNVRFRGVTEKASRLEALLEKSENERLEMRRKYISMGDKMDVLVRSEDNQNRASLERITYQKDKLKQLLNDEKRARKKEHSQWQSYTKETENKANEQKQEIISLQNALHNSQTAVDRLEEDLKRLETDLTREKENFQIQKQNWEKASVSWTTQVDEHQHAVIQRDRETSAFIEELRQNHEEKLAEVRGAIRAIRTDKDLLIHLIYIYAYSHPPSL